MNLATKRYALIAGILVLGIAATARVQEIKSVIGNVFLQDVTPGTAQIGHANIKGTMRAGQVNVTSVNSTIPFIGNNNATNIAGIGASFSTAGPDGIAARATSTAMSGFGTGLYGEARSPNGIGVQGVANGGIGVQGRTFTGTGAGVRALSQSATAPALLAENLNGGFGARFVGDVAITGGSELFFVSDQGFTFIKTRTDSTGADFRAQGKSEGNFAAVLGSDTVQGLTIEKNSFIKGQFICLNGGAGTMRADVKNFVQPDPDDVRRDIAYACVEGPEAAAYIRGTGQVVNGAGHVSLPRHFQNVSVVEGITVQITPLSEDSEGLAVLHKSLTGFDVKELHHGRGTYSFDWEVKAVRRGFADYKVYRPWDETMLPDTDRAAAMEGRQQSAKKVYGIAYGSTGP